MSKECVQTSDTNSHSGGIAGKTRYVVGETCSDYVLPRPVVAPQQPAPSVQPQRPADAFRNMFAILHNLDADELKGIASWGNAWPPDSLSRFVLKLDDARLDDLYALITSWQPERYRGIV